MRKGIRIIASLVLAVWLVWVYGFWAGLLPSDLLTPGPLALALLFFGTPFLCVILIGISNRLTRGAAGEQHIICPASKEPKSVVQVLLQFVPIASGLWFLSAFGSMFLTKRYPALHPFVWWTFAIWAGLFVAGVVGFILFSIGYGAVATFGMYRGAMEAGRIGKVGRVLFGIYFIIAFIVALLFTRW